MKKSLLFGSILLVSISAFAALPPYYDRVNYLKAVLDSDMVKVDLDGDLIESIEFTNNGAIVKSSRCNVEVEVAVVPGNGKVGPAIYEVESTSASCSAKK